MTSPDDEYEESVFVVDLQGLFDHEQIEQEVDQGRCRIGYVDSDQPLIQIGSNLFLGHWESTAGSDLLFREVAHRQMLSFVGSSEKRLVAQRVLLNPKDDAKKKNDHSDAEEKDEPITTQQNGHQDAVQASHEQMDIVSNDNPIADTDKS